MRKEEEILVRYTQGEASQAEKMLVESWYSNLEPKARRLQEEEIDALRVVSIARLENEVLTTPAERNPACGKGVGPTRFKLWKRSASIAAAVAAITLGVWLYYASNINGRHPELVSGSPLANDIAPGKNTATLTLANGKTIQLSDAKTGVVISEDKFTYNDGAEIPDQVRHDEAEMLTASTPRGGQYQVVLPDGTKVWLNADSKLEFPSNFENKKQRIVRLTGEGYFEVAKNKLKPFVVETEATNNQSGQRVEVLGTHFNINNYADEVSIKTTLLEGSIKVMPLAIGGSLNTKYSVLNTILKPNQQAVLKGEAIQVKQVDPSEAVAWKNGYFQFDAENLESVMNKLARWYDVEVQYENAAAKQLKFSGTMSRYDHISQVLKKIEAVSAQQYSIRGKTVILK